MPRRRHGSSYEWSPPYHGVSHLKTGHHRPQFTLEQHGDFVDAYVIPMTGFTPSHEKTFKSIASAKRWLEAKARLLLKGAR